MRVIESFFRESKEITSLDSQVILSLIKEMKEYIKDWPKESFEIKFYSKYDSKNNDKADVEEFSIFGVKDFVSVIAEGLGWKISPNLINEKEIRLIFAFLSGMKGHVKSDLQRCQDRESTSLEKVSYDFHIQSWNYKPYDDEIKISGYIDNVEVL